MADVDDKQRAKSSAEPGALDKPATGPGSDVALASGEEQDDAFASQLGATKWVQGAFFAAGICAAYLVSKVLNSVWNSLAEWPTAVRQVPQLVRVGEDDRPTYTLLAGAVIGLVLTIIYYRKENVRQWANDVAAELSKVTWPKREAVTNGTIVVLAAGAFATVYVGLLDRLWGFVTTLVYGA